MDLRLVAYFLGEISLACGAVLLWPFGLSLFYAETSQTAFLLSIISCMILGVLLWKGGRQTADSLSVREGIAVTGLGWLLVTFLGMLPYVFGGYLGFLDGAFESISGFTGTGATVIDQLEQLPESILLWRSLTHWLGGLGIIVLVVAFISGLYMPSAATGGMGRRPCSPRAW